MRPIQHVRRLAAVAALLTAMSSGALTCRADELFGGYGAMFPSYIPNYYTYNGFYSPYYYTYRPYYYGGYRYGPYWHGGYDPYGYDSFGYDYYGYDRYGYDYDGFLDDRWYDYGYGW